MNAERLDQKQLNAVFQEIFILSKDHNNSLRLVMAYDAWRVKVNVVFRVIDLPRVGLLLDISEVETNPSFQMS